MAADDGAVLAPGNDRLDQAVGANAALQGIELGVIDTPGVGRVRVEVLDGHVRDGEGGCGRRRRHGSPPCRAMRFRGNGDADRAWGGLDVGLEWQLAGHASTVVEPPRWSGIRTQAQLGCKLAGNSRRTRRFVAQTSSSNVRQRRLCRFTSASK